MSKDLDRRLATLADAAELADGRLDEATVTRAREVVARAGARVGLGLDTTVVALAGPTGAGKSTLFNALAGEELVAASVLRPTTSTVTAAVAGDVRPELLDWLGARTRHVLAGHRAGTGFVLLDLPDYDSVQRAHRDEVERLLELVDLIVWVVDPQKYADAALHDAYLRPLAGHGEAMVVVLNQADRLDDRQRAACETDLRRLLEADGLRHVPVLALSATTRAGVPALQELLDERVRRRAAAAARLAADVGAVAAALAAAAGGREGGASGVGRRDRELLVARLGEAAGVPVVVHAVAAAHRRNGTLATGWPYGRWLVRLRPDPLRRLGLGRAPDVDVHTSVPRPSPAQSGLVSSALRTLAAGAADGLADPWPRLVRDVATRGEPQLREALDRAVAGVDLRPARPAWWTLAGLAQRGLAVLAAAGVLWLVVLAAFAGLQLDDVVGVPDVEGIPLPTAMLIVGVLGGLLLALVARWANGMGAARRARAADKALSRAVEQLAAERVVAPVEGELRAREELLAAVRSLGSG